MEAYLWIAVALAICQAVLAVSMSGLKSYLKSKTANIAQKQDLADLTRIVENVKLESSRELLKLQTEVASYNKSGEIIISKEREAIINFINALVIYKEIYMDLSIELILSEGVASLSEDYLKTKNQYTDVIIAHNQLYLFTNNVEIINKSIGIVASFHQLHMELRTFKLEGINILMRAEQEKIKSSEAFIKTVREYRTLYETFIDKFIPEQKKFVSDYVKYLDFCRQVLGTPKAIEIAMASKQ